MPDKYGADCLWPSKPCTDLYFFLSDRFASSFGKRNQRGCCSQHVCYLPVPGVSKTACPWCGSLPQCISEKQLAYQAAGRGLMNRLCDLPPDRQRDRQQHWSQRREADSHTEAQLQNRDMFLKYGMPCRTVAVIWTTKCQLLKFSISLVWCKALQTKQRRHVWHCSRASILWYSISTVQHYREYNALAHQSAISQYIV